MGKDTDSFQQTQTTLFTIFKPFKKQQLIQPRKANKPFFFLLDKQLTFPYTWGKSKTHPPSTTTTTTTTTFLYLSFLFPISDITRGKILMDESESYPKDYNVPQPRRTTSASSASTTSVHVTALDGLVNVNSLFTIAVFVGLSLTTPNQKSLENRSACDAGNDVAKKLLVFEVVSFSFFLFSSLVAQGLKLAINLLNSKDVDEAFRAHISLKVLRFGMLGSAVGSVMGCLFLMLSMVDVIQIRLGLLSCGSKQAVHSVAALIVLVTSALVVYISTAVYAFLH